MIWLILTGLAVWSALLLTCWPVAALVLVVATPPVIAAGWWMHTWSDRIACTFGRCRRCAIHSTDDGIGGRCVACGKIHGWVTRDELRTWLELEARR